MLYVSVSTMSNNITKHIVFSMKHGKVVMSYLMNLHDKDLVVGTYDTVTDAVVDLFNTEAVSHYDKEFISFNLQGSPAYTKLIAGVHEYEADEEVAALGLPHVRIEFIAKKAYRSRIYMTLYYKVKDMLLSLLPPAPEGATESVPCKDCGAPAYGASICITCLKEQEVWPHLSRGQKGWSTRGLLVRRETNNWSAQD